MSRPYNPDHSTPTIKSSCPFVANAYNKNGKLRIRTQVAHQAGAYPCFCSMKRLGTFLLPPLEGMLVRCRVTPSITFAGTHLYIWVERGTVRVKCLAQEQSVMSPVRTRTRTARSRDERTNHEATALPTMPNNIAPLLLNCAGGESSRVHRRAKTADGRTKRRQKLTDCADIWEEVGEKWKSQDKVLKVLKKFNVRY